MVSDTGEGGQTDGAQERGVEGKQRRHLRFANKRSDEAIRRRAAKRGVTFEQQLLAEKEKAKQVREIYQIEKKARKSLNKDKPKKSHTVTSGQKQGSEKASAKKKRSNEDDATQLIESSSNQPATKTKKKHPTPSEQTLFSWPAQAGPERIEYNMKLRKLYLENPQALTSEELERARILVERDARKKTKKEEHWNSKSDSWNSWNRSSEREAQPGFTGTGRGGSRGAGRGISVGGRGGVSGAGRGGRGGGGGRGACQEVADEERQRSRGRGTGRGRGHGRGQGTTASNAVDDE